MRKVPQSQCRSYPALSAPALGQLGAWVACIGHWNTGWHVCPRRNLQEDVLIYCVGGQGTFEAGTQVFPIRAGDIFLAAAGEPHGYRADARCGWEIWWVHLRGDQLPRWARLAGFTRERPVRAIGTQPEVLRAFRRILGIIRRQSVHGALDAAMALPPLFAALHKTLAPGVSPDHTKTLLDAVHGAPADLDAMAAQAGMTRFAFLRAFRRMAGVTPWRYVMERRINRARALLLDSRLPVKTIAYQCGFHDADYFCRLFRRETGLTARAYRKNGQGQTVPAEPREKS
jgi:AraC family transcriptional regulator of arabinose operon